MPTDCISSAWFPVQGIVKEEQSQPLHFQHQRLNTSAHLLGQLFTCIHRRNKVLGAPYSRCEHWGLSQSNAVYLEKLFTGHSFQTHNLGCSVAFYFIIFFKFFIYFWLCWVFVLVAALHCSARASHCGGFSCCGAQALGTLASVVVTHGLSSCGSRALEHRLNSCGSRA